LAAIVLLFFTISISIPSVLANSTPTIASTSVWSHTYGSTSHDDYHTAKVVQATKDGGYIVGGGVRIILSPHHSHSEAWILKLDAQGHEKWRTIIGITASTGEPHDTFLTDLKQTKDNGYAIVGWYQAPGTGDNCCQVYIGKIDASGKVSWLHDIGTGRPESFDLTSDGGFIVAGNSPTSQAWLNRLNSKGTSVWKRTYTDSRPIASSAKSVQATSDGGFIVAGELYGQTIDLWIFKTDKNGMIKWEKTYQGPKYGSNAFAVQEKTKAQKQSGYIVLALRHDSASPGQIPNNTIWLLSLDKNGNVQWQKTIGEHILPGTLVQLKNGGYVIVTTEPALNGGIIKVSSQGSILWHHDYARNAGANVFRYFTAVSEAQDFGLVIAGAANISGYNDAWIIKTTSSGNCCKQLATSMSTPITVSKTTVATAHATTGQSHPTSTTKISYTVGHGLFTVRVQC
jgi:hypothetical protein